ISKTSHLLAVKRIFRYLKGKPSLGLWYSKDSPWELVAYTDSDYAGATQYRKLTTGGFVVDRSEKGSAKVSTASATKGTASEVPVVSTAEEDISTAGRTITYRRRSKEQRTRKDKGKAIMIESEPKKNFAEMKEFVPLEDVDTQEEMKEVVKEPGAKRKKSLPRKRRIGFSKSVGVEADFTSE
ncbi:hypothetical protein Tco_0029589, partial [Tanacetum coccineum]